MGFLRYAAGAIVGFILGGLIIVLLALLVCSAAGCIETKLPRQEEATTVVWRLTYHNFNFDPPRVEWKFQDDLNCWPDSHGRDRSFYMGRWYGDVGHSDTCVAGVTWSDWDVSIVAMPLEETFSTTAFAHELYHQNLQDAYGDPDPGHTGAGWQPGGIVDQAVEALAKEGL